MGEILQYNDKILQYNDKILVELDTDALSFLKTTNISNHVQVFALDTLVSSLKRYNLWAKMKAIYPFIGGTATTHKYNLKDPRDLDEAYRLTFTGGISHRITGVLPNGTTGYANTYLNPSTNLTADSLHLTFYSRTNANKGTDQMDIGAIQAVTDYFWLSTQYNITGLVNRFLSRNSSVSILANSSNLDASGFYVSSKTSNGTNTFKTYKNGVIQDTKNGAGANPNRKVFIFAASVSISPDLPIYYSNRECAFASIGDGLTDADALNLYNIVQTYQTALSRQV